MNRLRAYMAHADPPTRMSNLVAMVVGWNGPFYPIYVVAIAGRSVLPLALLTMLSAPFFLAVPALSHRSGRLGRLALPLVGIANTLWCTKLLGMATAVELFQLPCMALAALLFRREERSWFFLTAALALVAFCLPAWVFGAPLIALAPDAAARLAALNEGSVATLTVLIAWQFSALLREKEGRQGRQGLLF